MGRDLSDSDRISALERKLERYMSGAWLENASVTNGRLRFIGGLLLIDSGGTLQVIGQFNGNGDFEWSGPWKFDSGDGEIAGNVNLTGDFDLTGKFTSGNVRIEDGKIYVGEGAGQIVIDSTTLRITVGSGAAQIVIDGRTGKITAGKLIIDPTTSGGAVVFENGAQVFTDAETIQLYLGNSVVQVSDGYARLQHGGDVVEVNANGLRASSGLLRNHNDMDGRRWVTIDEEGYFGKIDPAFGGPGGGRFEYPFPESTITYGFRPPDRPTHDGLDMAGPGVTGQMIPAAARGVVTFAGGSAGTTGYGYYVIINHGTIDGHEVETLYGHMATAPVVTAGQTVAKGGLLGPVGNTGNSFGDHLHWEIRVDGEPVDPQIFMQQYAS